MSALACRTCASMMWPSVATPDVAQRTAPGRCARVRAGRRIRRLVAGVASSSTGEYITLATGTKSFSGSKALAQSSGFSISGLMAEKASV